MMNFTFTRILLTLALLGLVQLYPSPLSAAPVSQDAPDIVETAIADGSFETLVTALDAAGLVETLKGEGPFTIFAPTDAAFAELPAGTIEALLADSQGVLTDVLLYHVIAGVVTAADAVNSIGANVEMVNGQTATLSVEGNRLLLNDAGFVAMNIQTANGIIHVIDKVLVPSTTSAEESESSAAVATPAPAEEEMEETAVATPAPEEEAETSDSGSMEDNQDNMAATDIVDTAIAAGDFSTLVAAIQAAELVDTLKGEGPFTVFAPTDAAFAQLPEGTIDTLLADPSGALTDILLYHVIAGKVLAADVVGLDGQDVTTAGGSLLSISVDGDLVMVNDATVIATDIETSNGVIHVIDSVLIPSENSEEGSASESMDDAMTTQGECVETHTVRPGDTLSEIAAHYDLNIQTLIQINNIANPNLIRPGQAICIQQ